MDFCRSWSYMLFFLALFFGLHLGPSRCQSLMAEEPHSRDMCNIHQTACVKKLSDCTVTLDIQPKPVKAMTDLDFIVTIEGKKPASPPFIDLGMPGMQMGPNQVVLKDGGNNTYLGKGIIVRCPSGRNTWKAAVTVPDVGVAEFVFDVVY